MEGNGSRAVFVNVPIVTDSQHSSQLFEKGSLEAWGGLGAKGISDFYSYFSSSLSFLSLSVFSLAELGC